MIKTNREVIIKDILKLLQKEYNIKYSPKKDFL